MTQSVLYCWTNDLRVHDNCVLQHCKQFDRLLNVYVVNPRWFRETRWQSSPMGKHRWAFIQESLTDLKLQLQQFGQELFVVYGVPSKVLGELVERYQIDALYTSLSPGEFEKRSLHRLKNTQAHLTVEAFDQTTMYSAEQVSSAFDSLPPSFSRFERQTASWQLESLSADVDHLPPPITHCLDYLEQVPQWYEVAMDNQRFDRSRNSHDNFFEGGESAALKHVNRYFATELPSRYFQTRNDIDGWASSTKISAYLSQGCISPRYVASKIESYRKQRMPKGDELKSVDWIFKELLWREYFQWLAHEMGADMFRFKGRAKLAPLTSFYPERFTKWRQGETPYPLVNACMRELKQTGFLSNRGRQIVASCLVNELAIDWRYGAAWFEECLIDYDVASNWGNWQYIAGTGVDPRGGRHFNIEKQTERYDSDGRYRAKWVGDHQPAPLDSIDMVDWPIT